MCPFDNTAIAVSGKVRIPYTGLTQQLRGYRYPTDRPKSVRNRCVIKILVVFLCCHVAFLIFPSV